MRKKRYCLYLSRPLASKFDLVAMRRKRSKSAFLEDALRQALEPETHPGIEDVLLRRLDAMNRSAGALEREIFVIGETLALLVRYFLTITPPLASSEQEAARLLGKERYQAFLTQIGRRIGANRRFAAEVLETVRVPPSDLFASPTEEQPEARANGAGPHASDPALTTNSQGDDHHG
ncbi:MULTISPECIES: CopG family transcriptional regulator [Rhodomicrobium]|uniref:CopG family transcriptional regulator n=1 Tax=Rhodomicrobium TaxID=1068 RepID=UPI000B4C1706|nr:MULTISPECIES: CopG family transcriptional regulator [Rhodomicrobium]